MKKISIVFLLALLQSIVGIAQDSTKTNILVVDSGLHFTRYTNLPINNLPLKFIDKQLNNVRHVNKINRIEDMFYQQLSTEGSAHKPLMFIMPELNSFSYQPNVYDALIFTKENIKFYNVYKPYSQLSYSNTLGSSRYFSVVHAQNVFKNLQIGFEYNVNYTDGKFDKSQVMNQFFNATARYKNRNETYEGYLGFIRNRAMQLENGGLKSDSSFEVQEYSSLTAYPVNINSAYSKWKSIDGFLSQKISFGRHIKENNFLKNISIVHDLSYFSNSRIYNDQNPLEGYYQNVYFDTISTNDSLATQRIQNIISIRNNKLIPFSIGIKHDYILFYDTLKTERSSNFTPFFEIGVLTKKFNINFNAEYVLSNARYNNDFQIGGNIAYKDLYANVKLMNKSVDYFFTHYSSNNFIWSNNFKKTEIFNANIGYEFKEYFKLNIGYYALNNLVWINKNLQPQQSSTTTNIIKATFLHNFKLGMFNFNGVISLQKLSTMEAIRLPFFQTKQSIFINFKMFGKKLDTQIGVDLRYNTLYQAETYIASMGAFAQQNQIKIGNYLFADIFAQVKLERVKLFVTITHPYAGQFGYNYYQSPHYPSENMNFRFGVSWMFFD
ncbi:MAG: putative porin [Bacteroidales bacterium]